ncbi:MAG: protein kinase [Anaerolineales bacterium]|nr:protein kinase [Anaerolineales bacterium]
MLLSEQTTIDFSGKPLRVERRLSAGLTGEVFRGTLLGLEEDGIDVAIKAMKPLAFASARALFEQEMITLGLLQSIEESARDRSFPYQIAPRYYGRGDWQDTPFFVMELIKGRQLPDLLQEQREDRLPEPQALTIAWQLFRTLHILHSRLRKTYIDLKLENLWWVDDPEGQGGQLKLTDFGTLEEIRGGSRRGVDRDNLLAGVYLLRLLSGRLLDYSLGELRQRARPLINSQRDNISWGTRRLLQQLLHHDPASRLQDEEEIVERLRILVNYWRADPGLLESKVPEWVGQAHYNVESSSTNVILERARAAISIVARQGGGSSKLSAMAQDADQLLEQDTHLARGREAFRAGEYQRAAEEFRAGLPWAEDPAPLRRWSYLAWAAAGGQHGERLRRLVAEPEDLFLHFAQRRWDELLSLLEPPAGASDGLVDLYTDALLFERIAAGDRQAEDEDYAEAAHAYAEAQTALARSVDRDLIVAEELPFDLQQRVEILRRLERSAGESRRLLRMVLPGLLQDIYSGRQ